MNRVLYQLVSTTYTNLLYFLRLHTYHDARADCDASPTVRVGYDVPEPNTQESNGNQPHSIQEVRVVLIMEPGNH